MQLSPSCSILELHHAEPPSFFSLSDASARVDWPTPDIHCDQNEWEFHFKADTFYFQSMKMPVTDWTETPEDPSSALLERIYLIENVVKTIDKIYESFLAVRFSAKWTENEKTKLSQWLNKTDKASG